MTREDGGEDVRGKTKDTPLWSNANYSILYGNAARYNISPELRVYFPDAEERFILSRSTTRSLLRKWTKIHEKRKDLLKELVEAAGAVLLTLSRKRR